MIDTHSHIYLPQFRDDLKDVLDRASESGVKSILMPAIDFDSLARMDELSHPRIEFRKMAGIHPCDVGKSLSGKLAGQDGFEDKLHKLAASPDIIAVGETGLDYYWSDEHVSAQRRSFRQHCSVAKALNKPVVIHNRNSTADMLDIIEDEQDGRLYGVWHCFNGTPEEGCRALDSGLYLGIGGVITFKNAGVDRVVADLPLDKLLLETDAPYLAPVPKRGKRNEPSYMRYTARKLAGVKNAGFDDIDRITTNNAQTLFRLDEAG